MNYEQLSRIKAFISLYSSKVSTNILDGEFRSIYKGRSLDFDDLREYVTGDNVRDVDWKASSRTGKLLVRRYVAEKRHNILFVLDSGRKMLADTSAGEDKAKLAADTMGVIAYLVNQGSDEYALLMEGKDGLCFTDFGRGGRHFEELMSTAGRGIGEPEQAGSGNAGPRGVKELLDYAAENIRRRMIIVAVTDQAGVSAIDESLLRKVTVNNDLLVISLDDAWLTGGNVYDVDNERYESELLFGGEGLAEAEQRAREAVYAGAEKRFNSYRVSMLKLAREDEIIPGIIDLFERHRNGIVR